MRDRLVTIGLALALAAVGGAWTLQEVVHPDPLLVCLEDPSSCAGETRWVPLREVIATVDGGVAVSSGSGPLPVHGEAVAGLRVGQEVSIHATFTRAGTLQAHAVTLHPHRSLKRWLGGIGMVLLLGLLAATFTVRRLDGRLRVVPRA